MIEEVLIIAFLIPLAFWSLDCLVKILGSIPIDDVGADLCLFAVSFNATTVLISLVSSAFRADPGAASSIEALTAMAVLFLILSLCLYIGSLIMIARHHHGGYRFSIPWFDTQMFRTLLTVAVGFAALAMQITIYSQLFW